VVELLKNVYNCGLQDICSRFLLYSWFAGDLQEVYKVCKKNPRATLVPANCKACIWAISPKQLGVLIYPEL
jgi:hypothetical protein